MEHIPKVRLEEIVTKSHQNSLDKSSLNLFEKDFLSGYKDYVYAINNLLQSFRGMHEGTEILDLDEYMQKALSGFSEILGANINYWIKADIKSNRKSDLQEPSEGRFRLKYSSYEDVSDDSFSTCDTLNSALEKTLDDQGQELADIDHSSSLILQPSRINGDMAVIQYLAKNPLKPFGSEEFYAAKYFNNLFQDEVKSLLEKYKEDLTGLCNRRTADKKVLPGIDERSKKDNFGYAVLIIDIDHFKPINDTYGHSKGDEVLKSLSEVLSSHFRKSDMIARWGGEEFLGVYVDVTRQDAENLAESLRETIAEKVKVYDEGGNVLRDITASIGVYYSAPDDNVPIISKVGNADNALYAAKKGVFNKGIGRNRVEMYKSVLEYPITNQSEPCPDSS